jgi:hypothetical protein
MTNAKSPIQSLYFGFGKTGAILLRWGALFLPFEPNIPEVLRLNVTGRCLSADEAAHNT